MLPSASNYYDYRIKMFHTSTLDLLPLTAYLSLLVVFSFPTLHFVLFIGGGGMTTVEEFNHGECRNRIWIEGKRRGNLRLFHRRP